MILLAGAAVLAATSPANAEEVSVNIAGGLHVGANVHVNVDTALEVLADVELGWGVLVDFADPPPPIYDPCDRGCQEPVPSYGLTVVEPIYVEPIYVEPVQVRPVHVYVDGGAAAAPRPAMESRWGIGAFAGSMSTRGMESGSDLGIVGQYRFTPAFALELELAKSKQANGGRIDRRLGAALLYNLTPRRKLAPFLLAGAGYGQSEIAAGEFHAQQGYGEVGAGLRLRISESVSLVGDIRSGRRSTTDDRVYMSKASMKGATLTDNEDYTRIRVGGLLTF
jgi:hypothetical protein